MADNEAAQAGPGTTVTTLPQVQAKAAIKAAPVAGQDGVLAVPSVINIDDRPVKAPKKG
jgi:hypothetical protein